MEMIFGTPLIGPPCDDDETENEMQHVNVFPPTQFGPAPEEIQRSRNMTNDDDALSSGEVNNNGNVPTKLTNPLTHLLGGYDTDTDTDEESRAHDDEEDTTLPNEEPTRHGKNSTILCSGDDAAPSNNRDDNQNQNNATTDEKSRSSPGAHNANDDEEDTPLTKNEEQSNLDIKNSTMILCNIGCSPSNSDGDQSQKKNNAQLYVRLFEHATQCTNTSNCKSANCAKMKSYLTHWNTCTIKIEGSICATCKRIENLLRMCNTRMADSMLRMSCGNNNTSSSRPAISSEAVNNLGISAIMNKCLRNDIIMTLAKQSISIADNNRRRHLAAATTTSSSAYDNDSDLDDDDDDDSDEEIGQWVYQMAKSKNKDMLSVSSVRSTVAAISASSSTLSGTKRALEEEEEEVCSSNNDNVPTPEVGTKDTLVEVYLARDNETPRTIAKKLKLNCTNLVRVNKKLYPTLRPSSKLREGTSIQISHLDIIISKEEQTKRKIIATSSSK